MPDVSFEDAFRLAVNVLRDSAESRQMPSGTPLDNAATDVHAAAADELSAVLATAQRPAESPFAVELDPSFIRTSMERWRSATDMLTPLYDSFKIHTWSGVSRSSRVPKRPARRGCPWLAR